MIICKQVRLPALIPLQHICMLIPSCRSVTRPAIGGTVSTAFR